jgi:hypothetical protein
MYLLARPSKETNFMATSQNSGMIATFFIGGAADKNRFWYVGPQTHLIRDSLVKKYLVSIQNTPLFAAEINKTVEHLYYGYDEMDELFLVIQKICASHPAVKIRLVGHSLGGWKAAKLTEKLAKASITTALLITIDPVGIGYFMKTTDAFWRLGNDDLTLPRPLATVWINILANHTLQYDRNDMIADFGVHWQPFHDSGLAHKPNGDYCTPYSHADILPMMTFPGAASQGAWALLIEAQGAQ